MNTTTTAQENMERFTHEFTSDLLQSIQIAEENPILLDTAKIQNVIICGMGGSGIGGQIANNILSDSLCLPVNFCQNYQLPKYASEYSLVICSSYSGDTEETISLFEQALASKAQIIAICSGGELARQAQAKDLQTLIIPRGKQPRAAVGLSLVQQLHILGHLALSQVGKKSLFDELGVLSEMLKSRKEIYQDKAREIAELLLGKNLSVFTTSSFSALATRFCQQINENVKQKIYSGIIPEMCHNQLVAFADYNEKDAVIFINGNHFQGQNKKRLNFLKQQLQQQNSNNIEITAEGKSKVEITLKTLYLMDLISIELAKLKNRDPEEVEVLHALKNTLKLAHI
jgi:glucose/mannose-6-phosphate isomerase